jgi:hypothetical protein
MKKSSFDKLLEYIRSDLEVDPKMAQLQGGAIIPEVALYCTLRYLAGGSYSDIYFMAGISSAYFYCIVWKTISAINSCTWPFLGRCLVVGFNIFFFNGVINFDGGLHDDGGIINDYVGGACYTTTYAWTFSSF